MKLSLVVAVAENDVIGKKGVMLPWRLSADLQHFRELTTGAPIIMGRTTYETIGRPLPGRLNIILTRDANFTAEGCTVVHSLADALSAAHNAPEAFVIGGGSIYDLALPEVTTMYLTRVHARPEGDVFFRYNPAEWREEKLGEHPADEKNEHSCTFYRLTRV